MIEQIDDHLFDRFDNAEGDKKEYTARTLIIAYAHKIRELVNEVNLMNKYLESEAMKNTWKKFIEDNKK